MPSPVYVWTSSLECSPSQCAHYRGLLNAEERARADRFLRDSARTRFTASRGLLRTILGRLLEAPPPSFAFRYGYNGKPELVAETDLQFNLSHSGDRWYLAATHGRRLGVDVERVRPDFATVEIANRFFSPRELAELLTVLPEERAAAFFRCWTRKEAFIKAIGAGLGYPLDEFDVSLAAGAAELRAIRGSVDAAQDWSMAELIAPAGFCAALAVEGPLGEVRYEFCQHAK